MASEPTPTSGIVAAAIDHTLLKIDESTSLETLRRAVSDMADYGFRCLVVPPNLVATLKKNHPEIRVGTVISYPLGCDTTASKVFQIQDAVERGADEVDVVLDLFAIKAGNWSKVEREAVRITGVARDAGLTVKLIFETPILTEDEVRSLANAVSPANADYWKTSTGYGRKPSRLSMVRLLHELAPEGVKIKASGGIKTLEDFSRARHEGADMIGTSHGVRIVEEAMKSSRD